QLKLFPSSPYPATSWPTMCAQLNAVNAIEVIGSEDCLFLNVWTPLSALNSSVGRLPVLVFIHGGINEIGSISAGIPGLRTYDGTFLSLVAHAVVITLQYRLGAFGFFASAGVPDISANLALHDQLTALKFIQQLAPSVGGNSSQVLLFGQSAGGGDVCALNC